VLDDIPDARDGLTRKERVVLWVLRQAEGERKGRGVRAAMIYGRVIEHVDMSIAELMQIVERLSALSTPVLMRSQQRR
jgi:DNA gyrase/topoisomerase IV subunit A